MELLKKILPRDLLISVSMLLLFHSLLLVLSWLNQQKVRTCKKLLYIIFLSIFRGELDRFVDALIKIREEIKKVEDGVWDAKDNPLKNAPHPADHVLGTEWNHCYSREEAAYPLPWVKTRGKYWPPVGRIDNAFGDRNLVCTCAPTTDYF